MGPSAAAALELAPASTAEDDDDASMDELLGKLLEGGQSAMDLGMDSDIFEGLEDVLQAPLEASVSELTVPGLGLPAPQQQVRDCEGSKDLTQARSSALPARRAPPCVPDALTNVRT